jgi:hypothetical protein
MIFIVGPPRSGTTLMLELLGEHPLVSAHSRAFHRFHHDLMLFRDRQTRDDHFRLGTADATPEIARAYRAAITEHVPAGSTFVLKISTLSIQIDFVRALVPEARFIQMVRDGRDAICSIEDLRKTLEQQQGAPRQLGPAPDPFGLWCAEHFADPHLRAAANWYYHVTRSMLDLRFAGPDASLRVRYEDLIADPAATIERVLAFAGLQAHRRVSAAFAGVRDAPGKPGGIGFSVSQAKGPKRVGRFETDLSRDLRAAVAPLLERPMLMLGYDADLLSEPSRFDRGCEAIGADAELWRDRVARETTWFDQQQRVFAPERMLERAQASPDARPLLIDGAAVGASRRLQDGEVVEGIAWVQKQERRHTFPDPKQLWPGVAAALDGSRTIAELCDRFDLGVEAVALLGRLHDLGFVGYA